MKIRTLYPQNKPNWWIVFLVIALIVCFSVMLFGCNNDETFHNEAPVVNAGADQRISFPVDSVNLSGTATDPDGTIEFISWFKSDSTVVDSSYNTTIHFTTPGTYQYGFMGRDNEGVYRTDTITITVNPHQ